MPSILATDDLLGAATIPLPLVPTSQPIRPVGQGLVYGAGKPYAFGFHRLRRRWCAYWDDD